MIKFKEFIVEDKETFDYLIGKLLKTAKTINTHKSYGGHSRTDRAYVLATRYDNILEKIRHKYRPEWYLYCDKRGWAHNHNGGDMYA